MDNYSNCSDLLLLKFIFCFCCNLKMSRILLFCKLSIQVSVIFYDYNKWNQSSLSYYVLFETHQTLNMFYFCQQLKDLEKQFDMFLLWCIHHTTTFSQEFCILILNGSNDLIQLFSCCFQIISKYFTKLFNVPSVLSGNTFCRKFILFKFRRDTWAQKVMLD